MFESLQGVLATCHHLLCVKNQTSVFGDWTGFIVLHLLGNYLGREGLGWWNYQFTGCLLTYRQNNYWHFIVL